MYHAINATFEVKLNPINPEAKPLFFYNDVQIDASDEYMLEGMAAEFATEVAKESLPDAIFDCIEDYSITKEAWDALPLKEKVKYEDFTMDGEERFILNLEVDVQEEREEYPQTISEKMADIGMSERDFF